MGPLHHLKVLDIATIIAGPSAASLLADYGADVVKIELPGEGDGARSFPPHKNGKPLWWKVTNRSKRLITLDLRTPKGLALFLKMLTKFDVLIENFRPGTLDNWGLSKEVLWAVQPRLVILRTTGFGQSGPYRNRPGFARLFEAMGGLTHITGETDGQPMHSGYPLADNIGGVFGALGIMTALWKRSRNPDQPGEEIDLALTESMIKILEFLPIELEQQGVIRQRSGNANQYSAPASIFQTKDKRWVSLAGSTNTLFANNCRAIDRADLISNPEYVSNADRTRHASALNQIFSDWCASHNLVEVLNAFVNAQGTIAPVYDMAQIEADPHFQARHIICDVPDKDFGTVRMANVVPRFLNDPCKIQFSAGDVGQDNLSYYQDELGLSYSEIQQLHQDGVI